MKNPEMPVRQLSKDEILRFQEDGVIFVPGLYSPTWVETIRQGLNEICGLDDGTTETPEKPVFRSNPYMWLVNDHIRDLVLYGPTAHSVQQVLETQTLNLLCDQIFVKQVHNNEPTPWHHDFTFFPLAGNQIATVWTSVDPVRTEESALEFVVGSHRWPQRFRPLGVGGIVKSVAPMEVTPDFNENREDYQIASWDMEPGDAVIFHALTLHGSRGNSSGRNRRAIATRWCGDDARYAPTGKELQVPWLHGLQPGDPIGGPIFPQVLPQIDEAAIAKREKGPIPPDPAILGQNAELAEKFEKVPL